MSFYLEYKILLNDRYYYSGWAISSDVYLSGCNEEIQFYQRPDIDPHRNFGFSFSIKKDDYQKAILHLDSEDILIKNLEISSKSTSFIIKFKRNIKIFLSKLKAAFIKLYKAGFIVHPKKLFDEIRFLLNSDNWGSSFLNATHVVKNDIVDFKTNKFMLAIPIYNGGNFLYKCLKSVEDHAPKGFDIYLLDDCSNSQETIEIINEFLSRNKSWVYKRNNKNVGFLKNCNEFFKIALDKNKNVVLLNSDTIIYKDSLRNLCSAVIQTNGLVSPITNACSYASFPNPVIECKDTINEELINKINSQITAKAIRVPVSVGFCLGIKSNALKELKSFDTIFGKGYGEEVELSLRGNKKNIFSYIYTGSYVAHEHGSSFSVDEKKELNTKNNIIITKIYPWYESLIECFHSFKLLEREYFFTLINAIKNSDLELDIAINHHFGGGASKYLNDQAYIFKRNILSISYISDNTLNVSLYLNSLHNHLSVNMTESTVTKLVSELQEAGKINRYIVNHLLTMMNHKKIGFHEKFKDIANEKFYLWHDFYAICPNYTLVNLNTNKYCGVPASNSKECKSCWKKGNFSKTFNVKNIDEYRENMLDEIKIKDFKSIFFSESTQNIASQVNQFRDLESDIIPHVCEIPDQEELSKSNMKKLFIIRKKASKYNSKILILGGLNASKGSDAIYSLCDPMLASSACFIHLGDTENKKTFFKNNYLSYGRYELNNLKDILLELEIHSAFIPSIWPETFNYVADELSLLNIPFSAFNIGAIAERYKENSIANLIDINMLDHHKYDVVQSIINHR